MLNSDDYKEVTIHGKKGDKLMVRTAMNNKVSWVKSIYKSENLKCYTYYNTKYTKKEINTPSGPTISKKYNEYKDTYIQYTGQKPEKVKRKSKNLKKILSCGDQVKILEKTNKLKLKKDKDLAELLRLCEEG